MLAVLLVVALILLFYLLRLPGVREVGSPNPSGGSGPRTWLPMVGRAADAKRAKAASDIAELRNAVNYFRIDCDRLPTNKEGLTALVKTPKVRGWHGPYVTGLPLDPWGNPYHYTDLGMDQFAITCYGADGIAGGTPGTSDEDVGDRPGTTPPPSPVHKHLRKGE
jgi:general secretion pathway protein G